MGRRFPGGPARRGGEDGPSRKPRPVGDLLGSALKSLGLPSRAVSERVRNAWNLAAEPAWANVTRPIAIEGGVLRVGVASAALRQELTNFHAPRLMRVLLRALPDTPLVALRFEEVAALPGDR